MLFFSLSSPLLRRSDQIYHLTTKWVHDYIWDGMLVSSFLTLLISLATTGSSGFAPVADWPIFSFLHTHYWLYTIPFMLSIIYLVLLLTHMLYRHPPTGNLLPLFPASSLTLNEMHIDPRPHAYYARKLYEQFRQHVEDRFHRQKVTPVWVSGRSGSGKSRMLYELLTSTPWLHRAEVLVAVPTSLSAAQRDQLRRLKRRPLVFLLDDVQRVSTQLHHLVTLLPLLRQLTMRHIVILLASRPEDRSQLQPLLQALLEQGGEEVELTPMIEHSDEWDDFLVWVQQQFPTTSLDTQAFDGTPGSIILGLAQRTQELRQLLPPARSLLQTVAVLHEAEVTPWSPARVQRIAQALFAVDAGQYIESLPLLERDGWLQRSSAGMLEIPTESIFLCLQRAGYPEPGTTLLDEVARVVAVFGEPPIDAEAFVQISDMVQQRREVMPQALLARLNQATMLEQALMSADIHGDVPLKAALELRCGVAYVEQGDAARAIPLLVGAQQFFTRETHPLDWAAITSDLGNAYRTTTEGDRGANIEHAIEHLEASLDVYRIETFPQQFADNNINLATLYRDRPIGNRATNLDEGIKRLQNAALVYTQQAAPLKWAEIQSNLGAFYRNRIRGRKRANREQELQAYKNAAAVYEQASANRLEMARTLNNLGNAYRERLHGSHRANITKALACFRRALSLFDEQSTGWARTYNLMGMAYDELEDENRSANIEQAIAAYQTALTVLTADQHLQTWAWVTNNLGRAYEHRLEGGEQVNMEAAITLYRDVARPSVQAVDTHLWAAASYNIGHACVRLVGWAKEQQAFAVQSTYRREGIAAAQDALEAYTAEHDDAMVQQCRDILRRLHRHTDPVAA